MLELPEELTARLSPEELRLPDVLALVEDEMRAVYAMNVADHHDARGDNALLFALKIWHHVWFAVARRAEEVGGLLVVDANNSHQLRLGTLKVGIHKLGDFADDDIHSCFPDGSPTQRSYGERNRGQLRLFDCEPQPGLPAPQAFALRDLIVGHFGNPEEGLAKWYVGAYTFDPAGKPFWAWVRRQDPVASQERPDMTPFDARPAADVEVRPRRHVAATGQPHSIEAKQ
jgi:hypothetical protein